MSYNWAVVIRCYQKKYGPVLTVLIEKRSSEVLISIIRRRFLPETIKHSDCWRAYDGLSDYGYVHVSVNHTMNFINSQTGVHT